MRQWPDLRGLTTRDGFTVIRSKPSRSRRGRTRLVTVGSSGMVLKEYMPWKGPWEHTSRNIAILDAALREVVSNKAEVSFDRGSVYLQSLSGSDGPRAFLYEAFRGTLWPRYKWELPYNMDLVQTALYLIELECFHDELQGEVDKRLPVSVEDRPRLEFRAHLVGTQQREIRLSMREQDVPPTVQKDITAAKVSISLPEGVKDLVGNRPVTCRVTVHKRYDDP